MQNMGMVLSSWSLFAIVHAATGLGLPELDLLRFRSSAHLIISSTVEKPYLGTSEKAIRCVFVCSGLHLLLLLTALA